MSTHTHTTCKPNQDDDGETYLMTAPTTQRSSSARLGIGSYCKMTGLEKKHKDHLKNKVESKSKGNYSLWLKN